MVQHRAAKYASNQSGSNLNKLSQRVQRVQSMTELDITWGPYVHSAKVGQMCSNTASECPCLADFGRPLLRYAEVSQGIPEFTYLCLLASHSVCCPSVLVQSFILKMLEGRVQ